MNDNQEEIKTFYKQLGGVTQFLLATDTAPTEAPTNPLDKFRLYVNGGTKRLYVFDTLNASWYYVALT